MRNYILCECVHEAVGNIQFQSTLVLVWHNSEACFMLACFVVTFSGVVLSAVSLNTCILIWLSESIAESSFVLRDSVNVTCNVLCQFLSHTHTLTFPLNVICFKEHPLDSAASLGFTHDIHQPTLRKMVCCIYSTPFYFIKCGCTR